MNSSLYRTVGRSANASIRGYVYQAVETAIRWVSISNNQTLVCEGIEDIDQFDSTGDSPPLYIQVKDTQSKFSSGSRSFREALLNFANEFISHDGSPCSFLFLSTSRRGRPRHGEDLIELFDRYAQDRSLEQKLVGSIRGMGWPPNEEKASDRWSAAVATLDAKKWWASFLESVTWLPEQGDLPSKITLLERQLEQHGVGDPTLAADLLVMHVLYTSARGAIEERRLTRVSLDSKLAQIRDSQFDEETLRSRSRLARRWAATEHLHPGERKGKSGNFSLNAAYRIVPYYPRKHDHNLLDVLQDEHPSRVVSVFGPPLVGKTRALIEAVSSLKDEDWVAGFHSPTESGMEGGNPFALVEERVCVVLDHADALPIQEVWRWIQRCADARCDRARLVLISRSDVISGQPSGSESSRQLQSQRAKIFVPLMEQDARDALKKNLGRVFPTDHRIGISVSAAAGDILRTLVATSANKKPDQSWEHEKERWLISTNHATLRVASIKRLDQAILASLLAGARVGLSFLDAKLAEKVEFEDLLKDLHLGTDFEPWSVADGLHTLGAGKVLFVQRVFEATEPSHRIVVFTRVMVCCEPDVALNLVDDLPPNQIIPAIDALGERLDDYRGLRCALVSRLSRNRDHLRLGPDPLRNYTNFAHSLGLLGRHEECLQVLLEACSELDSGKITARDPYSHLSFLNNLTDTAIMRKRKKIGVRASASADCVWRSLEHPQRDSNLAGERAAALHNQAMLLLLDSRVLPKERLDCLSLLEEAEGLYRALAKIRPAIWLRPSLRTIQVRTQLQKSWSKLDSHRIEAVVAEALALVGHPHLHHGDFLSHAVGICFGLPAEESISLATNVRSMLGIRFYEEYGALCSRKKELLDDSDQPNPGLRLLSPRMAWLS